MKSSSRSLGGEIVLVAVLGDPDPAHQFHDEVRPARIRRAGIEHFGDVRMIHHRQRLPLGFKARDDLLGVHAQLDDLERDAAADRFLLFGHVNDAAAAFADLFPKFVTCEGPRLLAPRGRAQPDRSSGRGSAWWSGNVVGLRGRFDQFFKLTAQVRVSFRRANLVDISIAPPGENSSRAL